MFQSLDKKIVLVVNFGGPRNLQEVRPFLESLLTDEEVVRTRLPSWLHKLLFRRVAKKRAPKIREDYALIGGKSPIYEDTEWVAEELSKELGIRTLCFHRYLESTHADFLQTLIAYAPEEIVVFPLFPQFSYATTGSIARWFTDHLGETWTSKMRWVRSYPNDPAYIDSFARLIRTFLREKQLKEEETLLFCSSHGLPLKFVQEGDPYQMECEASFAALQKHFPKARAILAYQSKFGRGEWLTPATDVLCSTAKEKNILQDKKHLIIVPLSFTSDHIETLFEIEGYVDCLRSQGIVSYRCPALGRDVLWVKQIADLLQRAVLVSNDRLIRSSCCKPIFMDVIARPKISVYIALSIDGYIARPDGGLDWLERVGGFDEDYGLQSFLNSVDALIIGRKTYEVAITVPDPYPEKRVVVLSNTLDSVRKDMELYRGDLSLLLAKLQAEGVKHIWVDGGTVISQFLSLKGVDAMTLSIIPVVLGSGIPLFSPMNTEISCRAISSRAYPSGLVQVQYEMM